MTTAIEYFKQNLAEGRAIQGAFNKIIDGKKYVCLAAAWGKPGTIKSVADCPSGLFPQWVFELMPTLDDGVAAKDVPWLFQGFADRAEKMAAFAPEQWESVRVAFLCGVIDIAVEKASLVQPNPAPDYWAKVTSACKQVQDALKSGDMGKNRAAAAAARAAAEAWAEAWAAAAAAEAWAEAWAAAAAARAAWAAAAAAYREIASVFFACVDAQIK